MNDKITKTRAIMEVPVPDVFVRDGKKGIVFSYFANGEREMVFAALCELQTIERDRIAAKKRG